MRLIEIARGVRREAARDRIGDVAAMLTYYMVFSLFPMALVVLTATLLVLPSSAIQEGVAIATRPLPAEVAQLISEQIARMERAAAGGFVVVGALLALWSASRGALCLGKALNAVHGCTESRPWWKRQAIGIATILGVTVLIVLALALLVVGPAVGHLVADRFGLGRAFDVAWGVARWLGAALLVLLIWAIVFKYLPDKDQPLRVFTPGAVIGVVVWVLASQVFALYVAHFGSYEKTYGALGAVIVFLTWLWLSSVALLLGAEVNNVAWALKHQRRKTVEDKQKVPVPTAATSSAAELVRRITSDLDALAKSHVELARIELSTGLRSASADAARAVLGGIVGLIGLLLLCVTAVVALAPLVPPLWLRMLMISIVYLLVGGAVAGGYLKKLREEVPRELRRTKRQARFTARALASEVSHG
ncbi:MAG: YihY/virulence factor BrkB family protein [Deltaproteobacteria bacterium]|nr:YihY/virulence factor BrkB family protein [Deltaproteobacteria bacterium]